jgi:hypothetical protein
MARGEAEVGEGEMRCASGRLVGGLLMAAVVTAATVGFAQTAGQPATLPPAVTRAFQQAYPGAAISASAQVRDNNRTVFRVEGVDKGRRRVVLYDPTGAVVEVAEQVDEKALPKPVADEMYSHPRAIFVSGLKVTRGGTTEYRLTLRGTRKTAMVVKPDGTVISFK